MPFYLQTDAMEDVLDLFQNFEWFGKSRHWKHPLTQQYILKSGEFALQSPKHLLDIVGE